MTITLNIEAVMNVQELLNNRKIILEPNISDPRLIQKYLIDILKAISGEEIKNEYEDQHYGWSLKFNKQTAEKDNLLEQILNILYNNKVLKFVNLCYLNKQICLDTYTPIGKLKIPTELLDDNQNSLDGIYEIQVDSLQTICVIIMNAATNGDFIKLLMRLPE
jgi:hypothetical protein